MKKTFATSYLSNLRLILFGYLLVIVAGILAFVNLPREMMPSIDLPMVIVSTVLPGSSPTDIEDLVTIPLEDSLRSIKEIDVLTSSSLENSSLLIAQFVDGVSVDDALREVQQKVSNVRLPSDAQKPYVSKIDFSETPVWVFAIKGDDKVGLNLIAEEIETQLEKQNTIDRVEISGLGEREIVVYISPEKMVNLGLHPAILSQAIASVSNNAPAGNLNLDQLSYAVSLDKNLVDLESLRQLPLIVNGKTHLLGEIAEIYEQDKPGNLASYQLDQSDKINEVITLTVYKVAGSPIDANAKLAREVTETILEDYPQFQLQNIMDFGAEISKTFTDLGWNIVATFILVFIVMLVFLGVREAVISAVSIPLVILLSFVGMSAFGLSLNFISLFALLLVLGMLVDNAIVVATALSRAYDNGKVSPLQAGVSVWHEYFMALIATNLTTVWAFLPLILITGMMGAFLKPISIVVTVAILGSALVAFLLTLPLGIFVLKAKIPTRIQKFCLCVVVALMTFALIVFLPKTWLLALIIPLAWLALYLLAKIIARAWSQYHRAHPQQSSLTQKFLTGFISTSKLESLYQTILQKIFASKRKARLLLICIVIATIFSFSLLAFGLIKSEFFPKEAADSLDVELTLPAGSSEEYAEEVLLEFLPQFSNLESIDYVTAQSGRGSSSMIFGGSSNKILFTVNLVPKKERTLDSIALATLLRDKWSNNPHGTIKVIETSSGPPSGADLQLSLAGEDLDVLGQKADQLSAWLATQPGVTDITSSLSQASKKLVFQPDQRLLNEAGLSNSDVSLWLRSNLSGWPLGKLTLDGQEEDIVLRQHQSTPGIDALTQIQIPSQKLGYLPLVSLGDFVSKPNLSTISRQDYQRVVTVSATVQAGYSAPKIGQKMQTFAAGELDLPDDYQVVTGGSLEQNATSMQGIQTAMIIAGFLILMTLVIQLRSFRKAFIVMSVIPVAISGVFICFALFGISLTLPALIGVLALFGIVVNNSILIVERINQNLQEGQAFIEAVIEGSKSRLQPILLTSLTTIVGLIPITFSDPMWQGLGSAIIAGLTFSGVLLLFYIPVLYSIMFDPHKLVLRDQKWTTKLKKFSK